MPLSVGDLLGPYRLVSQVGAGGMGVVWKAEDTRLGRAVAVKILPADRASDPHRRELFLHEARLASTVSDARIAQVFDLGHHEGIDFIVMEYVEGEALSELVRRRGALPPEEVAAIGSQVAQALAKAHRKGLLHRDVKPANILLQPDGEVKLIDFGVSALLSTRGAVQEGTPTVGPEDLRRERDEVARTPAGSKVSGTPAYMSPEHVRGEAQDARSDIYSLGVVLYELTTGKLAFGDSDTGRVLEDILRHRLLPLPEVAPGAPPELARIIGKAMALRALDRYQSTEDLAVDLRQLGAGLSSGAEVVKVREFGGRRASRRRLMAVYGTAVLALAMAVAIWWHPWSDVKTDERTILIMPFEVRGQETAEDAAFVGRAFAEALAINLSSVQGLTVLPPRDSMSVEAHSSGSALKLATSLGAGKLVTGAIERQRDTVTVHVSLLSSSRGALHWGTRERRSDRFLSDIAHEAASGIATVLGMQEARQYRLLTEVILRDKLLSESPLAWEAMGKLGGAAMDERVATLSSLVRAFPTNAAVLAAYATELGNAYQERPLPETEAALDKVVAQLRNADPNHPSIERIRAYVLRAKGHSAEAINIYLQLLDRSDLSDAYRSMMLNGVSDAETNLKRFDDAIAHARKAIVLMPTEAHGYANLSRVLRNSGKNELALAPAQHAVALQPEEGWMRAALGRTLSGLGRHDEALSQFKRACELMQSQTQCAEYAIGLLKIGRREESREAVLAAEQLPLSSYGGYNLGCYWAIAGDSARALNWLNRALDAGYGSLYIETDPDLESLHGNARFDELVARLKQRVAAQ